MENTLVIEKWGIFKMPKSCRRFLQSRLSKGGGQAYVALLMLGAMEKSKKDLLKKYNMTCIQSNLAIRNSFNNFKGDASCR